MSLYHSAQSKDNCGFGLIAHLDGNQSHQLLQTSMTALTRMTHRGAISSDGKTGDGCGLLIQLPSKFFRKVTSELGYNLGSRFGVGQIFLSSDPVKANKAKKILEQELIKETLTIVGWRDVPVDTSVCGEIALKTQPKIEQIFVNASPG